MRLSTKIWLIAALSLILLAGVVFASVMTALDWDFTRLYTIKYETNEYEITDDFSGFVINTDVADIDFVPSENGKYSVECYEQENMPHEISVKNGMLTVRVIDTRKWYEYISINFESPKITVCVPAGEYGALSVKSSTGDVTLPKEFSFESIDITQSTGDVTNHASASGSIKIRTSTGDITVENVYADSIELSVSTGKVSLSETACRGDITVGVSTGKADISRVNCQNLSSSGGTGSISMNDVIAFSRILIKRSTGDVRFTDTDAAEISIRTSTGDVTGSLLSGKDFIADTNTGRINLPESSGDGRCEISTDTGDIKITVKPQHQG